MTDQVSDGPWNATLELKSGLLDKTFHAKIRFAHGQGISPAVILAGHSPDDHHRPPPKREERQEQQEWQERQLTGRRHSLNTRPK